MPLTRPERSAEWRNVPAIKGEINRRGGCGCCALRDKVKSGWDHLGSCTVPHRTFPLCLKTPGLEFVLDESTIAHLTGSKAK